MFMGSRNRKILKTISAIVGVLVIVSMVLMYTAGTLF